MLVSIYCLIDVAPKLNYIVGKQPKQTIIVIY